MMIRNKRVKKFIALFFLANMLNQLLFPTLSFALTNGPNQIEFTSFQSPGATDMVNPLTGDFTYSMDILEVPGPEGGFTLPLSYNGGIKPEQQASWVGLGWGMNAGAISRSMVQFPDDASGQHHVTHFSDEGVRGWSSKIPGVYQMGWDSEGGHWGDITLMRNMGVRALSWDKGGATFEALGVSFSGSGVKFSATEAISDGVKIISAAITAGTATGASALISTGTELAVSVAADAIATRNLKSSLSGFGEPTTKVQKRFLHRNYWIFVNENRKEEMYGSLYFQDMPTLNSHEAVTNGPTIQGEFTGKAAAFNNSFTGTDNGKTYFDVASDMHIALEENQDYGKAVAPVSIAHDYFSVMGQNISGSIKPTRMEVGSLSYPKQMSAKHYKYNVLPYRSYKPQFRYEGSLGNTYTHHKSTYAASNTGISTDWVNYKVNLDDPVLKDPAKYTEADRYGLKQKRLAQGKHVEWFTNAEISAMAPNSPIDKGYLLEFKQPEPWTEVKENIIGYKEDCNGAPPCDVVPEYGAPTQINHRNKFRALLPEKGIGAFVVTAEDGTTYHYALPVYQYVQFAKVQQKSNSSNFSSEKYGSSYDPSKTGYATTWLLTAITGPDFVDRGPDGVGNGIIDAYDWGRWVKLDYGKFSGRYKWRIPYAGYTTPDEAAEAQSYTEGFKETYYLNSISTRTHTALFIKDARDDGRGHYTLSSALNSNLGINEQYPSSSLKLDEVIVLTNEDYEKASTAGGLGTGIPALNANMGNNAYKDAELLRNGDTFSQVLDVHDINSHSAIRNFLKERALKRIVFNYTYELCPNTTNSFSSATAPPSFSSLTVGRRGKLTLRSLSAYGPFGTKLVPDYVFEYGNNPAYDPNKWDGYGLYNRYGNADIKSHKPPLFDFYGNSPANQDAAAWSLTKVITPLGGTMEIAYERDTYAYVSEFGSQHISFNQTAQNELTAQFNGDLRNHLKVGDKVNAEFIYSDHFTCQEYTRCQDDYNQECLETNPVVEDHKINQEFTVTSVSYDKITVDMLPEYSFPVAQAGCQYDYTSIEANAFIPKEINGGDTRVREIIVSDDQNNKYKTRYDYSSDLITANGRKMTSGIIAQEPDFVEGYKHSFYDYFDYPVTSVMYGKVTVLKGRLKTDTDYTDKTEFYFNTPASGMIAASKKDYSTDYRVQPPLGKKVGLRAVHHSININTSQIGQLLAMKRYNSKGMLEQNTELTYGSQVPNKQGIAQQGTFTEGTLLAEMVKSKHADEYGYKIIRTTKAYIPSVVTSTKTTANGMVSTETNREWDFYTGEVLKKRFSNSLGHTFETEEVPAYHIAQYAGMGSKADDISYKNMLTQRAAGYLYKIIGPGSGDKKLIAASVQTWGKSWQAPRAYDSASGSYVAGTTPSEAWRKYAGYAWKSTDLDADGSIRNFTPYDWAGGAQPNWVTSGEVTHYTRNSKPLQARDINGSYHATKYGYNESQVIASAANARYTEIAFSGAEDPVYTGGTMLFGGEVRAGQGQLNSQYLHTGSYSLRVDGGGEGFSYKAKIGERADESAEIEAGRKYRASVWVHASDKNIGSGNLRASLSDGTVLKEVRSTNSTVKLANNWFLLEFVFQVPATSAGKELSIACKSTSGTVYFDDFRFHPLDAPMTTAVYDQHTKMPTYVIDNNNMYVRYYYDHTGSLKYTLKAVLTDNSAAEKLVDNYTYHFARMTDAIWLKTGNIECQMGPNGYTGIVREEYKDVNTSSPTSGHSKWIDGQYSSACPACVGPHQKWINGTCETGVIRYSGSIYIGDGLYECRYYYTFSDGSQSATMTQVDTLPCRDSL